MRKVVLLYSILMLSYGMSISVYQINVYFMEKLSYSCIFCLLRRLDKKNV